MARIGLIFFLYITNHFPSSHAISLSLFSSVQQISLILGLIFGASKIQFSRENEGRSGKSFASYFIESHLACVQISSRVHWFLSEYSRIRAYQEARIVRFWWSLVISGKPTWNIFFRGRKIEIFVFLFREIN